MLVVTMVWFSPRWHQGLCWWPLSFDKRFTRVTSAWRKCALFWILLQNFGKTFLLPWRFRSSQVTLLLGNAERTKLCQVLVTVGRVPSNCNGKSWEGTIGWTVSRSPGQQSSDRTSSSWKTMDCEPVKLGRLSCHKRVDVTNVTRLPPVPKSFVKSSWNIVRHGAGSAPELLPGNTQVTTRLRPGNNFCPWQWETPKVRRR